MEAAQPIGASRIDDCSNEFERSHPHVMNRSAFEEPHARERQDCDGL